MNVSFVVASRGNTYGPYDEAVLTDIRQAVSSELLSSKLVTSSGGGYGYEFSTGNALSSANEQLSEYARPFEDDIDWVVNLFGGESAGRMELMSTIIFGLCDNGTRLEKPQIVQRVNEIKPHFSREVIDAAVDHISEVPLPHTRNATTLLCSTAHDDNWAESELRTQRKAALSPWEPRQHLGTATLVTSNLLILAASNVLFPSPTR